jgi:hypothetical protein
MKYLGSCLCGHVKFEVEGDFEHFYLCHCEKCRKDTGSAHAANLFSSKAKLKWLKGQDKVRTYNHLNEGHIKSFCEICGSALPNIQMDGNLLVVPAGSLDSEIEIKPSGHIFYDSKANWDRDLEKAKKYKDYPYSY